jgi:hypothetical protein
MYSGTMIKDLIATVECAEYRVFEAEILQPEDDLPLAYLLEQSYGEQLVEVA